MKCPTCNVWSFVKETRHNKAAPTVRRRYECANGHRFTTEERVVTDTLYQRRKEKTLQ